MALIQKDKNQHIDCTYFRFGYRRNNLDSGLAVPYGNGFNNLTGAKGELRKLCLTRQNGMLLTPTQVMKTR